MSLPCRERMSSKGMLTVAEALRKQGAARPGVVLAVLLLLIAGVGGWGYWRYRESTRTTRGLGPSKTVVIYEDAVISGNTGISTGFYTPIDGYRYVNVFVEFEQHQPDEEPVSLGVVFAHDPQGRWGARRYYNFEGNMAASPADPQMITLSGRNSWHGSPHDRSSYIARLPVMGPYLQVFPFNHHSQERKCSVVLYLTK